MLPKSDKLNGLELSAFWLYILIEKQGFIAGFMEEIINKLKEDQETFKSVFQQIFYFLVELSKDKSVVNRV